jgi:aspartyl-tRNA(Asn)/glutamyl-tRNA(Gln) amidotransferase subunit C
MKWLLGFVAGCYNEKPSWRLIGGEGLGLSREEVEHIALLARLGLSEEGVGRLREQLSDILENFEVLQQVDTTDVPPTAHVIALENVTRDDEPQPSFSQDEVLANAPQAEEGCFRVRAVLE